MKITMESSVCWSTFKRLGLGWHRDGDDWEDTFCEMQRGKLKTRDLFKNF